MSIKQCKYIYQRAGRKDKRCTRVCRTEYCGDYCSSHYWQLNRFTKNTQHIIHEDDTFENIKITSEKKVPLFELNEYDFDNHEWLTITGLKYDDIRTRHQELNKIELSKLASENEEYMKKFPHIKIKKIN
jgi:hypothetical protein